MGDIHEPASVLLLVAASSRYDAALDWGRATNASSEFGPLALVSDAFDFTETDYYTAEMGDGLKKQFSRVEQLDRSRPARRASSARRTLGKPSTRRSAGTRSRGR